MKDYFAWTTTAAGPNRFHLSLKVVYFDQQTHAWVRMANICKSMVETYSTSEMQHFGCLVLDTWGAWNLNKSVPISDDPLEKLNSHWLLKLIIVWISDTYCTIKPLQCQNIKKDAAIWTLQTLWCNLNQKALLDWPRINVLPHITFVLVFK